MLTLLLAACSAHPDVPEECIPMCAEATVLYGDCLDSWGLDWAAAGYSDSIEFQSSCETWGWEMAVLEADAVDRGRLDEEGAVAAECDARYDALVSDDASCATYTELDWNTPPWD